MSIRQSKTSFLENVRYFLRIFCWLLFTLQFRPKAPAKRLQHVNATYRNIVGSNMLRAFGHPVAICCDMLGVDGSNLKMVKFFHATFVDVA